jgi:hypothetical protein
VCVVGWSSRRFWDRVGDGWALRRIGVGCEKCNRGGKLQRRKREKEKWNYDMGKIDRVMMGCVSMIPLSSCWMDTKCHPYPFL